MTNTLLDTAALSIAKARAIKDEFEGKTMPADVAHQMDQHLRDAANARKDWERGQQLENGEAWLSEPQYKRDMGGGSPSGEQVRREQTVDEKGTKTFLAFARKGLNGISLEQKADLVEDATGELLVPHDYAGTILKELPRRSTIRNLAFVRPTTRKRVDVGSVAVNTAGWGPLETGTVATDGLAATPADDDQIIVHDLNALVKIGRDELEDSDEGLAETIRQALALKIAEIEDDALAFGDGAAKPFGVARSTANPITQTVTAAANATITYANLVQTLTALPAIHQENAHWVMHSSAFQAICLLMGSDNRPLIDLNSTSQGPNRLLLGKPWHICDGLPSMTATGTAVDKSIVVGDFRAAYMVADRRRLTVQRLDELYAAQGKVGFLFTHRVGGDVIRPKALAAYLL